MFAKWFRKTAGFLVAAYGAGPRPVLEWIEDQDQNITMDDLKGHFRKDSEDTVSELEENDSQLHVALLSLTEGESFDIVFGAAPHGFEALCRLIRRWDPSGGGRRRSSILRAREVEVLARRYEKRRAGGTVQTMGDDIKTSKLEAFVPSELEQHLAKNRSSLLTYDHVVAEIQAYIEARRSRGA